MKALADPDRLLGDGLAAIRAQFAIPEGFAPAAVAEAETAALRPSSDLPDRTAEPFVTLDPAESTDLDQAFHIETVGGDLLLHYALADVGRFVPAGGAMESEAWRRGLTLYIPDGKARLYPEALSERAASLLPDGPRPAIVVRVRCAADGAVRLDSVERALVRSHAKLGYETAQVADIPLLGAFAARMRRGEDARAAARVDPPEQEVERGADGAFRLVFRPWTEAARANSFLSLAANLAIADALYAARTGLFREMAPPDERSVRRLRLTARGLGLSWPDNATLPQFERTVDARSRAGAAFLLAARRAGTGASYVAYADGHVPWHAALGATYTHATAPMRRLADRYVLDAVLAVAGGAPPPPDCVAAFARLPAVMDAADAREAAVERAVIDLAEAALLAGREGELFAATVTDVDERGARLQLSELPVVARVEAKRVAPGDAIRVRLVEADPTRRSLRFQRVN